jgi:tetratricopeptide (TPR) repeat protein
MLTQPLRVTTLLAVLVACPVVGCASRDSAKGRPAHARRPAPRSQFETSRDPPIAADTRYAAGQLAEARGALPQAAEQYRQALRDNPKHAEAMYRLGVVYAGMKKFPEAIDVWKRYTQATNDSAAGYSNLGFCYELARKPEEAEAAYLKGIRRDPKHVASRVNYGLMLVRRGRTNEGTLQLQAVLTPAEVHYNLGSVYETLGRPEQARAEYGRALELDPALADAQSRLDEIPAR